MEHVSKFRNIYGTNNPSEKFIDLKFYQYFSESTHIKANNKWVAFPWQTQGGGALCVLDITKPKKVDVKTPKINGHKALVTDFDFCPFEDGNFINFRCNSNRI